MSIDNLYAAYMLIEILYKKGLINKATFNNVRTHQKSQYEKGNSHISKIS
ncbi:MAG: hypothetical protein QM793_12460 [Muricomes sp.]